MRAEGFFSAWVFPVLKPGPWTTGSIESLVQRSRDVWFRLGGETTAAPLSTFPDYSHMPVPLPACGYSRHSHAPLS